MGNEPSITSYCFICKEALPKNHKYKRCDKCFDTRCLLCLKPHTPGYRFRRCPDCFETRKI